MTQRRPRRRYVNENQRPVSSFRFSNETWSQLEDLMSWTRFKTRKEVVEQAIREYWMSGSVPNEPPKEE